MSTPIEIITAIAKRDDTAQAILFFIFFSRFEYALKRAGYTTGEAQPDWDKYAKEHIKMTERPSDPFKSAMEFLKNAPPKKQVVKNNKLDWEPDNYTDVFNLERILVLVRRIRNNLFHGGKWPGGLKDDDSRNADLIDAGLKVLQACLELDRKLQKTFSEKLPENYS